ncbi:MAG: DNA polymerase III subunit gamma/tau [SAR324 cluster bacterium]|nr:DNA polymerase III subunit gamma/tau [SAR324 cluster bacterium]MBL7035325.1 DNA polymerase III subunit gamma/tau [SAR324 cluster bacterium]
MSYVVLARRLRPSRFADLIGQETAAQTLRNAVLSNRAAHAFLFTGSRGVGKTSAARILTRALNCLNPDNGDPCNTCENCVEINHNASPDVYEIDAASNRGIENIRELRENVNYVPARCRYKIYIIDEAHMLTLESFNALLKTLEEPPAYVKFIFATTDPYKIPPTIISRCQRYDFLRIPVSKMVKFLETVIKNEKLELSRGALEMIARNSVGGMRDALTAIDQILSFSGTTATDQKVAQILGILDRESRFEFVGAILKKKQAEALRYFQQLQEHGHDVHDILSDLLQTIKTIALVKTLGTEPALFQEFSTDDLDEFETLSKVVSADELQQVFQILLGLEEQMKRSVHKKICFEMAILQISAVEPLIGLPELIRGIKNISKDRLVPGSNANNSNMEQKKSPEHLENEIAKYATKQQDIIVERFAAEETHTNVAKIKNILQSGGNVEAEEYSEESTTDVDNSQKLKNAGEDNTQLSGPTVAEKTKIADEDNIQKVNDIVSEPKTYSHAETEAQQVAETAVFQASAVSRVHDSQETGSKSQEFSSLAEKSEDLSAKQMTAEDVVKPAQEWIDYAEEVQKRSSKLASIIRNAVPQILQNSQLKLSFKSGNYSSMLTEQNRVLLEKITSDWTGHAVHVSCEISAIVSTQQTIFEYEQILIEQQREIKREKARNFPQVKEILSVFTNSKITGIKLSEV